MDEAVTPWLPSNVSGNNSSDWNNRTVTVDPIYVFTPASVTAKSVLCIILSTTGAVGFLGNSFIFSCLWKQKFKNQVQSNRFFHEELEHICEKFISVRNFFAVRCRCLFHAFKCYLMYLKVVGHAK